MSTATSAKPGGSQLIRILGLGFSLAVAFGGTVGVGILRLPGEVAAALGDPLLITVAWIAGGLYATLGAISLAELAAAMPQAGGFYVYSRRAFGERLGFTVGWSDWIANTAAIATAAITSADYLVALFPGLPLQGRGLTLAILGAFTALHWIGLRVGSGIQGIVSAVVGMTLVGLAIGCLFVAAPPATDVALAPAGSAAQMPVFSMGMLFAVAVALRLIVVTYDGWYGSIYLVEETTAPTKNLPRALILCTVGVTLLYVLINVGFMHALSIPQLAVSKLPAADVAKVILPAGSALFVQVISLITVLGLVNVTVLSAPRILYGVTRDGRFARHTTQVSRSGTPRVALLLTTAAASLLIITGTFDQVIAMAAVFFVLNYLSAYLAVIRLRRTEPALTRPWRAWGYPWTTGIVVVGSIGILATVIAGDLRSAAFAMALLAVSIPVRLWNHGRSP